MSEYIYPNPFSVGQRSMSVGLVLFQQFLGGGEGGWGSKNYVGVIRSTLSDVGGTNFLLFLFPLLILVVV
jgi:hypothetical protein